MKRILLALLLLLLPVKALAALAHVASVIAFATGNSVTTAMGTTTTGNLLVCGASYYGAFGTLTDTESNTWQTAVSQKEEPTNVAHLTQRYAEDATVGADHQFTLTADTFATLVCHDISGAADSAVFDVGTGQGTASSTEHTSGNPSATGQAAEIGIGHGVTSFARTSTVEGTWTEVQDGNDSGNNQSIVAAYKIVSSAGVYPFAYTLDDVGTAVTVVGWYKEAVTSPPASAPPRRPMILP